jgi:hypothetical protein
MKKIILSLAFVHFFGIMFSQRHCATMGNLDRLKSIDPDIEQRMLDIELQTQSYIEQEKTARINNNLNEIAVVRNIPVVVHVLYNTTAQNISDAQIQSQIAILNNDFRRLNADKINTPTTFTAVAADAEINFCLASVSPTGAATNGITRTFTSKASFAADDKMKSSSTGGVSPWPTDKYLNIWVCNLGGGLLGYAQFPGGSAATDGVVVGYNYFGNTGVVTAPFNKGRTATHEVGHWLNLRHIWGDATCGSDNVTDTPTHNTSNYGCPSHPKSNSCGTSAEMFMNYMDYTDDGCMNMFTLGQKSRMQALFATGGQKASLLTSNGCGTASGGGSTTTCAIPSGLNATSVASSSATLNWSAVSGATSYAIQYKPTSSSTWISTSSATNSKSISGLSPTTTYQFQIKTICSAGSSAYSTAASFITTSSSTTGTTVNLGSGTTASVIAPYGTYYMDEKVQFILTKAELIAAGYSTTNNMLRSLAFNVSSAVAQVMNGFTIKMRHTGNASFTSTSFLASTGMTTLFTGNVTAVAGWNTHTFSVPFNYDGVNNVLVEICWNNSTYSGDSKVFATTLSTYNTLYLKSDNSTGGICANTTGTRTKTRPNMRLNFSGYSSSFSPKLSGEILEENSSEMVFSFNIYPNPVKSILTIELNNTSKEQEEVKVIVFNLLGEIILEKTQLIESGLQVISLELSETQKWSSLPDGFYICSYKLNGEIKTGKFILQK